jgi:hypothetical protein
MKKIILFPSLFLMVVLGMYACKKSSVDLFIPDRQFTPQGLSVASHGDTAVTISWKQSVNSATGLTYTVQVATDTTFATPALSFVTTQTSVLLTDDSLADGQKYYVRVKANGGSASADSYWMASTSSFSFVGVQIFKTISSNNIIDVAAILSWTTTPGVSMLVLTAPNGNATQIPISDSINTAGQIQVNDLSPNTKYTAQIFAGTKQMGSTTFTTQATVAGANVIDLRTASDANDPNVLIDTLPLIPAGSTVLLQRGMTYNITSSYIFTQTVTIMSGLGFSTPAVIALGSQNFDASGNIDSIRFADVTFATNANGAASYVFNISAATTIGTLTFENCTTQGNFGNSFIRLKAASQTINNLVIDNCILDSIGVGQKYAVIYPDATGAIINNMSITNSTFYYISYFIRDDDIPAGNSTTVTVSNCTFNNFLNQSGYLFEFNTGAPAALSFNNCIFGSTNDPTAANGVKSGAGAVWTNCYQTSDCTFSGSSPGSSNSTSPYPTKLSVASTALFTNPGGNPPDFTLQQSGLVTNSSNVTAGDPRWIP